MRIGYLKKLGFFIVFISLLQGLATCGILDKDKDEDTDSETFDSRIPSDWDLKSDWAGSVREVESL